MSNHQVLNNADHRDLRVLLEPSAERGDAVMGTLVTPIEFRRVQAEYPIVFRKNQEDDSFTALALFGFENGENLFLKDGNWDARYRPLSLAIQPFLIGRTQNGEGVGQVHIDMDHPRVSKNGEGTRVFDEDGGTTPFLEDIAGMLGELDQGHRDSAGFFDALKRHDLLEPFTLEVPLSDGSKHSLVGFHIVNESKLQSLDGDALADLHGSGHLMPVFMALASLSHFSDLVERKDAKVRNG
ncbi:SapC family protein [Qipengyuania gaetbuli]|uniref:SapC family protein n=1 Tax=Qipengyuania gaetbuli TaxID=266952 RepID=UPI001CFC7078|nr:SapC family protein [Qipengyuania gaetbuli]